MSQSHDVVLLLDGTTSIIQASASWKRIFGEPGHLSEVLEESNTPKLLGALALEKPWERSIHLDLRDKYQVYQRYAFSRTQVGGLHLLIGRSIAEEQSWLQRIVELRHNSQRTSAELKRIANTDPLTGVSNRREVWRNAQWIWTHTAQVSVVLIDVDKFKRVNDIFGHEAGDQVLQGLAESIVRVVGNGIVGRWGGEEFIVIFEGDASERLDALVKSARNVRFSNAPADFKLTISVGMAIAPDTTIAIADAFSAADAAMYSAKEAGGDRFVLRYLLPRSSDTPASSPESDRRAARTWKR